MPPTAYRGRRAVAVENAQLRVTLLVEGGHVAEILDKRTGINPLWTPQWPSIEPSAFSPGHHALYGAGADGKLLAGIMGHNLCLDIFGGPSADEFAAGLTAHGEGAVVPYQIEETAGGLLARADFPMARLSFARLITLEGATVRFVETVVNLTECDRPVGWTQHVTLGAPFLKAGVTEFRASASSSQVFDGVFGPADYLKAGGIFDWPMAPRADGGAANDDHFVRKGVENRFDIAAGEDEPAEHHAQEDYQADNCKHAVPREFLVPQELLGTPASP